MRNLSIPKSRAGQGKIRSLSHPSLSRKDGIHFWTHCATCHGVDGSGKTPVGSNLYPRAPDPLSISDHAEPPAAAKSTAIIKNGGQLTGMPAWNRSGASDVVWKLALFVASLGPDSQSKRAQESGIRSCSRGCFVLNRDQGPAMVGQVRGRFRRYLELRLRL